MNILNHISSLDMCAAVEHKYLSGEKVKVCGIKRILQQQRLLKHNILMCFREMKRFESTALMLAAPNISTKDFLAHDAEMFLT